MNKVLAIGLFMCLAASSVFAEIPETDYAAVLVGTIIDTASAYKNKDSLADLAKTYTKDDALTPEATAAGYGIFMEDSYMQFDKKSTDKIVEFLKKPESKLRVTVKAMMLQENIFTLLSIENS